MIFIPNRHALSISIVPKTLTTFLTLVLAQTLTLTLTLTLELTYYQNKTPFQKQNGWKTSMYANVVVTIQIKTINNI
jgi:hypothetical protein